MRLPHVLVPAFVQFGYFTRLLLDLLHTFAVYYNTRYGYTARSPTSSPHYYCLHGCLFAGYTVYAFFFTFVCGYVYTVAAVYLRTHTLPFAVRLHCHTHTVHGYAAVCHSVRSTAHTVYVRFDFGYGYVAVTTPRTRLPHVYFTHTTTRSLYVRGCILPTHAVTRYPHTHRWFLRLGLRLFYRTGSWVAVAHRTTPVGCHVYVFTARLPYLRLRYRLRFKFLVHAVRYTRTHAHTRCVAVTGLRTPHAFYVWITVAVTLVLRGYGSAVTSAGHYSLVVITTFTTVG